MDNSEIVKYVDFLLEAFVVMSDEELVSGSKILS